MPDAVVLIPARLAATRLPDKPLAEIAGVPMIVHVMRRALAADIGRVAVATEDRAIAEVVEAAGGTAVMTGPAPNGTARIHAALAALGSDADVVVNLQGDLPDIAPETIQAVMRPLAEPEVAIATACAEITRPDDRANPNVVKIATTAPVAGVVRCLYFSRSTIPWGRGRCGTTSASTPTGAPRSTATWGYRHRHWKCANGWSSSARSKPACASTPRWSIRSRPASIPPTTSPASGFCWAGRATRRPRRRSFCPASFAATSARVFKGIRAPWRS